MSLLSLATVILIEIHKWIWKNYNAMRFFVILKRVLKEILDVIRILQEFRSNLTCNHYLPGQEFFWIEIKEQFWKLWSVHDKFKLGLCFFGEFKGESTLRKRQTRIPLVKKYISFFPLPSIAYSSLRAWLVWENVRMANETRNCCI